MLKWAYWMQKSKWRKIESTDGGTLILIHMRCKARVCTKKNNQGYSSKLRQALTRDRADIFLGLASLFQVWKTLV